VFFFPVILSFMLYDFNLKKSKKVFYWIVGTLIAVNLMVSLSTNLNRIDNCTATAFYDFGVSHNESIYFGIYQPYLDYYGKEEIPPYSHQITINCNTTDTFIAEDWRNAQLMYLPYEYCLEEFDGRYD